MEGAFMNPVSNGAATRTSGKNNPTPQATPGENEQTAPSGSVFDPGWGRLLYAPSFASPRDLAETLMQEAPGRRDIAVYVDEPQLVLAEAPTSMFLDPSLMFRRMLDPAEAIDEPPPGVIIRPLTTRADIAAINRLYSMRNMVTLDTATVWSQRASDTVLYLVAEDEQTGEIVGSAMGIDHTLAFSEEQKGSSLWCLVVDPQSSLFRTGQSLVNYLIAHFTARGCAFLDLSVMHNNENAIGLYRKLKFEQIPGFSIKHKNAINESLFSDTADISGLNPYARIIVDEARRRGIAVEVLDAEAGIFKLRQAGQEILCRESLSELTGGVAMTWCQDKVLTLRRLASIGLRVPHQRIAGDVEADRHFLREHGSVVVKPAMGEQGRGVSVDVRTEEQLTETIERAQREGGPVVIEEFCSGQDLRIVVIGYQVVAAAIRRPAQVTGDGTSTIARLIELQSARRAAATGGESKIPVDAETERCLAEQGLTLESVPEQGSYVQVRKTANLHSGGTIHDVTDELHPVLREAAETAARALRIPVVGLDFLVPSPDKEEYVIIEANERPGLANHEPQPTAQRFIDLLFPFTA
jgi:GNAT-family acetyltransferase (TIGR03103 family)